MKKSQGAIILAERVADYGRLRSVLRGWGYRESEIQRLLKEPRVDPKLETRRKPLMIILAKSRIACRNSIT